MRQIVALLLFAFVAFTLYQGRVANPLPDGSKPIATKTKLHVYPTTPRVDGEIIASDPAGAELGRWYLDAGRVYVPVDTKPRINLSLVRHQYLYDPGLDLGTFAGYATSHSADLPGFQVGVRVSPARLAWGAVSPDVVITSSGFGAGLSAYPPGAYFGRWWDHIGVGAWYIEPFDGGSPSLVVGLAFSTRR